MCEANVYLKKKDIEEPELVMESVDRVVPLPEEIVLQDIFGVKKSFSAKISKMVLVDHKILLEEL